MAKAAHAAVKHVNVDPEETISVIIQKLDAYVREAPPISSLEEVRMFRETLVALSAVVKDRRSVEDKEIATMSEDELRQKAIELGLGRV